MHIFLVYTTVMEACVHVCIRLLTFVISANNKLALEKSGWSFLICSPDCEVQSACNTVIVQFCVVNLAAVGVSTSSTFAADNDFCSSLLTPREGHLQRGSCKCKFRISTQHDTAVVIFKAIRQLTFETKICKYTKALLCSMVRKLLHSSIAAAAVCCPDKCSLHCLQCSKVYCLPPELCKSDVHIQ